MAARRLRFYAAGTRTRGDGQVDVWDVESWEDPPEQPRRGELRDPR
jgi:hypothetical protein